MCLCLYAVAETTIIARDSDLIYCASEIQIAKMHFYDLPLTTEWHIYLTKWLPNTHLLCKSWFTFNLRSPQQTQGYRLHKGKRRE